jgi:hypothetical protein
MHGPPIPSRRVMSSARRDVAAGLTGGVPRRSLPAPARIPRTRIAPARGPAVAEARRARATAERVAGRAERSTAREAARARPARQAVTQGLEFAGKHKGLIAGGIGLALGAGSLLRNQGPGVSGNGYMPTGSSSGGGGYR